jgi:branched-chain amino acid transport system substrate-binding protein
MAGRSVRWLAPVVALAFATAACGGDDDDDSASTDAGGAATTAEGGDATTPETSGSTDTTTADGATQTTAGSDTTAGGAGTSGESAGSGGLGDPNPATGDPVKIGLITEEGSNAIGGQSLSTLHAFEMGVDYLNEFGGGLGGHEIELVACGNQATPAGAQDCAQQMVEEGVASVVLPFDCCGDDQVPIVTGAGIPYVVYSGSAPSHLTTPGAFSLSGGYVSSLAAVAAHARDEGITKVVHVVIDVPSATTAARDIGGLVFGNAGVDYEVVTAAPGTPDLTPQLSTAGDAAVMVTGDLTFCTSFNQAYATLGMSTPKYQIATCIDPSVLESVPDAFEGSFLPTTFVTDSDDAALYEAILAEYDDTGIDPNPYVSGGTATPLSTLLTFARFFEGFEGELTAETAMEQMRTATDVPLFLSTGTATCDGTAIPMLPNVCAAGGFSMATLDASGVPTSVDPVDDMEGLFAS